jgi:hypothetical protein
LHDLNNSLNLDAYTDTLLIYCRSRHSIIVLSDCFGKFAFIKANDNTKRIPISVIVCAKNEEENVAKFIPLLWTRLS